MIIINCKRFSNSSLIHTYIQNPSYLAFPFLYRVWHKNIKHNIVSYRFDIQQCRQSFANVFDRGSSWCWKSKGNPQPRQSKLLEPTTTTTTSSKWWTRKGKQYVGQGEADRPGRILDWRGCWSHAVLGLHASWQKNQKVITLL